MKTEMNFKVSKNSLLGALSVLFLGLAFAFNIYGAAGVMNLLGYGSSGDYNNPATSLSGAVHVLSGETLTGATQITLTTAVKITNSNVNVTIPNGAVVQVSSGTTFNPSNISTNVLPTLPLPLASNESDVGKIKFGIDGVKLNFSKPVKLELPVNTTNSIVNIKVKHAGESGYNSIALTDSFASSCLNGVATPSSSVASVSNGIATIYTCSASEFIAVTTSNTSSSGGGGGGGALFKKDTCPYGDFSPSYYDRECGSSPVVTTNTLTGVIKEIDQANSNNNIQTVRNLTVSEKLRFKYVVEGRTQTIKHGTYDVKYVSNYDLSNVTLKISKIIANSKTLTNSQKKTYIDNLNKYLIAKFTYDLSEPKTQALKDNYVKQAMVLRNMLKTLSK